MYWGYFNQKLWLFFAFVFSNIILYWNKLIDSFRNSAVIMAIIAVGIFFLTYFNINHYIETNICSFLGNFCG